MTIRISCRALLVCAAIGAACVPAGCDSKGSRTERKPDASGHPPTEAKVDTASGEPGPADRSPSTGLTTAELFALLDEDIARLEGAANDATGFGPKRKMLRTDALALAVYAQVGIDEGEKTSTKKLSLARNGALGFAGAAGSGDRAEAGRAVALARGFRSSTADSQPRSVFIPLNRIMPMTDLMEQAGLVGAALAEYEAVAPADWDQPTKRAAVVRDTWRMAALVRTIARHCPETDPNPKNGQTRKLWQEAARDCRAEIDGLLTSARSGTPANYAAGYKALDAACNRCHAAYRVE